MAGFSRTRRIEATSVAMIFFSYARTSASLSGAIFKITSLPSDSRTVYAALNQPSFNSLTASSPVASAVPPKALSTIRATCSRVFLFFVLLSMFFLFC